VISTSWGICEAEEGQASAQAEETIFEQMATQGQSLLAAAGDAGSEDCYSRAGTSTALAVDDPGSDPYVTSVGGTTLNLNTDNTIQSETVWNNGGSPGYVSGGAGGGGVSTFWSMPSWQTGHGVVETGLSQSGAYCGAAPGTYCREVPDVAAAANPNYDYGGYSIFYSGQWTAEGGTSGAAPLWAALAALADESCGATKPAQAAGLLNPALYKNPSDMNDITSGDNDYTGTNNGDYPAGAGYDMASGLGSPTAALFAPGVLCVNQNSTVSAATVSASNRQQSASSDWTYTFTTGSTGSLSAGSGTVTLGAPAGTAFPTGPSDFSVNGKAASAVTDGTTANGVYATITVPTTVTAGAEVTVVISGVTNPAAAVYSAGDFTVATSSDTAPRSPSAGLDFGFGASNLAVTSSSVAARGSSTWTYDFSITPTGALSPGDTVTLVAPSGATFPTSAGDYALNGTTVAAVAVTVTGSASSVTLTVPVGAGSSSPVDVAVSDMTNPTASAYPASDFSAYTIADAPVAANAGLTFASGVTSVAYSAAPSQAGQSAQWHVNFDTSVTGSLALGDTVTLSAPAGTVWPNTPGDYLLDSVTPSTISVATPANSVTITLPASFTNVGASTAVSVSVSDVTNPPAGNDPAADFTSATSVDTSPGQASKGISFGSGVTAVSLSASSSIPGVASVVWTYQLHTSATGALTQGDSLTVEAPASASFPASASDYTVDGVRVDAVTVSRGATNTSTVTLPSPVGASTQVKVVVSDVTNPAQGSYPGADFAVSTTADTPAGSAVSVAVSGVTNPPAGTYPASDFSVSTATDTAVQNPATGFTFAQPTPSGYRLVGADGGVFSFGDAAFYGSVPGLGIHIHDVVAALGAVPAR
jgi:hypothetical protein